MIYSIPELGPEEHAAIERIHSIRDELRYFVGEPRRWVGSLRRVLGARAVQGSNSIEGYNVTMDDAVAAVEGADPTEATEENWQAVMGYSRAMTYVLQLAHDKFFDYSPSLIRSLHFMITEYSLDADPGLWRPGAIWVRSDATGDVVYEGPPADEVPGLVDELVEQLRDGPDAHPLVTAAMAHLNLVLIHPFRDGNGRISRCLQTLVLAREQILAPEWCSIEEYLGRHTESYYAILTETAKGRFTPTNDPLPWVRYCLRAHYIQALSVLRRVRESEEVWRELERIVDDAGLKPRAIHALFDASLGLRVRNSSYRTALAQMDEEVSNQVATTDLTAVARTGLLEKRGEKRGTHYVAGEQIRNLRKQAQSGRTSLDDAAESLFSVAAPAS